MKKLNLTEVKTIARQIALDLYEMKKASFDKAVKNPKFKKDLIALAKSHPVVALYPTLAPHEQPVLLDCISSRTNFENSLKGSIKIPNIFNINSLEYYNIYSYGYKNEMQRELNSILTKYKIPTEGTNLVHEYYGSGPEVNESSKEFQAIRDKIIIAQIDCKDLQSLIKQVTKFFA